jgi:hypothetical protein
VSPRRSYIYDYLICENPKCESRYEAMRQGSKYCSTKCRVAHNRALKSTERKVDRILEMILDLDRRECATRSVSEKLLRCAKRAATLADEWEFVRPIDYSQGAR